METKFTKYTAVKKYKLLPLEPILQTSTIGDLIKQLLTASQAAHCVTNYIYAIGEDSGIYKVSLKGSICTSSN